MNSRAIKRIARKLGADICGIAPADRFNNAPAGFHPRDVYSKCRSVLVFAKRLPSESIQAESCVPYSHINSLIVQEVDSLTYRISLALHKRGVACVIIPTDDPYEHWEPDSLYGRAILSLRHAGCLAGLGYLGKNTLLINRKYGTMIQVGAVLLDLELPGDEIIEKQCPDSCTLCLDNCPARALDGTTVNQKKCRPLSVYRNEKGYVLKKCSMCRKICPRANGYS